MSENIEKAENQYIWAESYRPTRLKDVILPAKVRETLQAYVDGEELPNFMFYSPSPGTGKTTSARVLANELGIRPLFINGSLQNSIDDVRVLIKDYATTVSLLGTNHKIVIVDECDRLSKPAQESLKALIEEVSSNCRFIFTTNSKSKIVEPLLSRCIEVDFVFDANDSKNVSAQMYRRVGTILTQEGVEFNKQVVAKIVSKYSPDNRKILQVLQNYSRRNGIIDEGILADIESTDVETLVAALKEKDFKTVLNWCANSEDAIADDFYTLLYKTLKDNISQQSIPELILILGAEQKHHNDVPDMFLHAAQLCTQIMMQVQFK